MEAWMKYALALLIVFIILAYYYIQRAPTERTVNTEDKSEGFYSCRCDNTRRVRSSVVHNPFVWPYSGES